MSPSPALSSRLRVGSGMLVGLRAPRSSNLAPVTWVASAEIVGAAGIARGEIVSVGDALGDNVLIHLFGMVRMMRWTCNSTSSALGPPAGARPRTCRRRAR